MWYTQMMKHLQDCCYEITHKINKKHKTHAYIHAQALIQKKKK